MRFFSLVVVDIIDTHMQDLIEEFRKNKKTTFLADEYIRLENEEESVKKMATLTGNR